VSSVLQQAPKFRVLFFQEMKAIANKGIDNIKRVDLHVREELVLLTMFSRLSHFKQKAFPNPMGLIFTTGLQKPLGA